MGPALLIVGVIAIVVGIVFSAFHTKIFVKDETVRIPSRQTYYRVGAGLALSGMGAVLMAIGAMLANSWQMQGGHIALAVIGNLLMAPSFLLLWLAFYVRFYKKGIDESFFKKVQWTMFGAIPASLLFFLLAGEGIGPYLPYPLANGVAIGGQGIQLYTYLEPGSGLQIAFYGVVILAGAIVAWKISDHHMYQKYGRHGLLDACFLWAFPMGIVGARVWYVVGNWNGDGAGGPNYAQYCAQGQWWRIFAIWEGGLTILGGAVGGILAGMLFMLIFRRYIDLRIAMDLVIPTILIAQAIGRWGNFFNHEVYGAEVAMSSMGFLPVWLRSMMATSFNNGIPSDRGYVPLFLIEGAINIAGYFLIYWGIRLWWKKTRALGSLSACYLIWYGIVRMILEPLRDRSYNMGQNGWWSFWNSMAYVLGGVAMIVFFQLFALYRRKKGLPEEIDLSKGKKPLPTSGPKKAKPDIYSAPKQRKIEDEDEPHEN